MGHRAPRDQRFVAVNLIWIGLGSNLKYAI
jgi:hypothetical protein